MKKRPINLNLMTMKFPIMAIVSIMHRISGVLLFLLLPLVMYGWQRSLINAGTFMQIKQMMSNDFSVKFLAWVVCSAAVYHIFAGIRHIIMDFGYWEHLDQAKRSAWGLLILVVILCILLGIWLW